ncbi:hypothetical protein OY671_008321 [Metschnikowia pulcherrima]|nr:hypothetical protein OY671_008321 [Metschnikowia pulcherrima]
MAVSLTEEQVGAVRERISRTTERQIATRGIDGTSSRSIATEIGWTAASLYRYFASKGESSAAARAAAHDRFSDRIEAAYASADDPWQRSRAIGDAYVAFAFTEPAAYQLIFAYNQPDSERTDDSRRAEARSRMTMTGYVRDMVTEGSSEGDPDAIAQSYWAASHGSIVLHMANKSGDAPGFERMRHEAARLITRGARPLLSRQPDG